eukprot:361982-Chlamydomonas_euryale.AAC.6
MMHVYWKAWKHWEQDCKRCANSALLLATWVGNSFPVAWTERQYIQIYKRSAVSNLSFTFQICLIKKASASTATSPEYGPMQLSP